MPILGYSLKSITAEKKNPNPTVKMDIASASNITAVEEASLDLFGKQPTLGISFEFKSEYKPDVGIMKFVGDLIYTEKDIKNILKEWKKNKRLPPENDAEIRNFLFRKCLKLALDISEELQLPPPLAFPVLVPKKQEEEKENKAEYIG